jgi:hypothetical protein
VRRLNQGFIVLVIVVACYVTVRSMLALGCGVLSVEGISPKRETDSLRRDGHDDWHV